MHPTFLAAHPVLYQTQGLTLYTHGLFFALGAEIALLYWQKKAASWGLETRYLFNRAVFIFIGGLLAARLGYFLIYPSQFKSLLQVAEIWQGGLVSYFGIAAGLLIASYLFKKDRFSWLFLLSLSTLLAWSIGRLGNYYAGDSVGVNSSSWTAFYGRIPIQLFESVWTFCLFCFFSGKYFKPKTIQPTLVVIYCYLLGRFFIDSWRDEGIVFGLHLSQWTSLILLILLTCFLNRKKLIWFRQN